MIVDKRGRREDSRFACLRAVVVVFHSHSLLGFANLFLGVSSSSSCPFPFVRSRTGTLPVPCSVSVGNSVRAAGSDMDSRVGCTYCSPTSIERAHDMRCTPVSPYSATVSTFTQPNDASIMTKLDSVIYVGLLAETLGRPAPTIATTQTIESGFVFLLQLQPTR